jgi:hypothetical protein
MNAELLVKQTQEVPVEMNTTFIPHMCPDNSKQVNHNNRHKWPFTFTEPVLLNMNTERNHDRGINCHFRETCGLILYLITV